jgi:PTS system galactitol-specific IIA component
MRTEHIELSGETAEEALTELATHAHDRGYVDDGYADALREREAAYPTGLDIPTTGFAIAIPHADPDHVSQQAVVLGLPPAGSSVTFYSMDDPDETVEAEIVVLLLVTDTEGYTTFLSNLAKLFQADEFAALTRERNGDALLKLILDRCVDVDG